MTLQTPVQTGELVAKTEDTTSFDFTFAGDLMAHTPNFSIEPFDYIYSKIAYLLRDDDLSFVNLETPVDDGAPYATYPLFNVHSPYVWAAIEAGFDVFSLANNHSGDRGAKGVPKTQTALESLRVRTKEELGRDLYFDGLRPNGNQSARPFSFEVIRLRGKKIGFVSIAEYSNVPSVTPWMHTVFYTNPAQAEAFLVWVASIRPSLDLLVVGYHWGTEYATSQGSEGAKFSRQLVDAGVDVLWGHHPHVLQPWYKLESPRGDALVLPSMGNFVSGQAWFLGPGDARSKSANRGDSALVKLEISLDKTNRVRIDNVQPVLISSYKTKDGGVQVRTMIDLIRSLDGPWREFYRERFNIMSAFYPESLWPSVDLGLPERLPLRNIPE